jgi:hypothetical protein
MWSASGSGQSRELSSTSPRAGLGQTASRSIVTCGGVLLVTLIMVSFPAVGTPWAATVIVAPYHAVVNVGGSAYHYGCGTGKITKAAAFSKPTGFGGFAGTTTAPCFQGPASTGGSASSYIEVFVPLKLASGNRMVQANWTLKGTGSELLNVGACKIAKNLTPSGLMCYQDAFTNIYGAAFVIDNSNGTITYPSLWWTSYFNATYSQTSCNPNCTTSGSGVSGLTQGFAFSLTKVWNFNITGVVSVHKYWLDVYFMGYAGTTVFSCCGAHLKGGGTALASYNFGTLGNGARLNSIIIS